MLTCIACSKQQMGDEGEDGGRETTSNKDPVKSLSSQIKDMVLKLSGVYRQGKPSGPSSSSTYRKSQHVRYDSSGSIGVHTKYYSSLNGKGGSSSTIPSWDLGGISTAGGSKASETWFPSGEIPAGLETLEDEEGPKEWVAQVEPGVHITFLSLPHGGNDLKRIRFSRDTFNKWQAQRWWGENFDRIMELYNVQRFSCQALTTPPRSEDENESSYSRVGSTKDSPMTFASSMVNGISSPSTCNNSRAPTATSSNGAGERLYFPCPQSGPTPDPTQHFFHQYQKDVNGETSPIDSSRTTANLREEASISTSNQSEIEMTEWVEQDAPGVYVTIRQLGDGTRELRRVRFSRDQFQEGHAKLWWGENRERIHAHYL